MHLALKMAATKAPTPNTGDIIDLGICFCERLTYAKCWLRVCPRTYRVLKDNKDRGYFRDRACEVILEEIRISVKKHMLSSFFQATVDHLGKVPILNLLQLFFVEMGRYKRCNVFVEPSMLEKTKTAA